MELIIIPCWDHSYSLLVKGEGGGGGGPDVQFGHMVINVSTRVKAAPDDKNIQYARKSIF